MKKNFMALFCILVLGGCASKPENVPVTSENVNVDTRENIEKEIRANLNTEIKDKYCYINAVADQLIAEGYLRGRSEEALREQFVTNAKSEQLAKQKSKVIDLIVATPDLKPRKFGLESYLLCAAGVGVENELKSTELCFGAADSIVTTMVLKQANVEKEKVKNFFLEKSNGDDELVRIFHAVVDTVYSNDTSEQSLYFAAREFHACKVARAK